MTAMGSAAHQALIDQVTAHYAGDPRVRAVAVFGSVGSGTWHELPDVDLDIVIADGVVIDPGAEARALFGDRAAIVIARDDSADIVLDALANPSTSARSDEACLLSWAYCERGTATQAAGRRREPRIRSGW